MSNKKKKSSTKANQAVKKKTIKPVKIIVAFAVLAVAGFLIGYILGRQAVEKEKLSKLYDYVWVPSTASNASGDEVELAEIYDTNYTSYKGSMTFEDDGKFSLWLSPGDPTDGTHSGTYKLDDDKKSVDVTFDNGTTDTFELEYNGDEISTIIVDYNSYTVCFIKQ